ncbi:hypothetical protein GQ44DRAFT_730586 [Phaeosphaeriaceae sp. PMI808]|nr:hypothetical protein GQ44DRAFT_730586 [Phaeosphaeriaceae sp. PMI808]
MDTMDSEKRPLCLAIARAVAHLENQFEQKEPGSRLEFIEALAGEAARALNLNDIADCLVTTPTLSLDNLQWCRENKFTHFTLKHPETDLPRYLIDHLIPNSDSYIDSAPQDALIAALSTKRFQLAKRLLEGDVKAMTKSPAFGVPLQVAATMGAQKFVQTILDELLRQGKEEDVGRSDIEVARRFILQGAAAGGHEHIVRMILGDLENNRESLCKGLSRPIMSAVENGHEDVASLLLQHRAPISLRESAQDARSILERREARFWRDLSKKAARHGCENILRIVLESTARVRRENDEPFEEEDTYLGGM